MARPEGFIEPLQIDTEPILGHSDLGKVLCGTQVSVPPDGSCGEIRPFIESDIVVGQISLSEGIELSLSPELGRKADAIIAGMEDPAERGRRERLQRPDPKAGNNKIIV